MSIKNLFGKNEMNQVQSPYAQEPVRVNEYFERRIRELQEELWDLRRYLQVDYAARKLVKFEHPTMRPAMCDVMQEKK